MDGGKDPFLLGVDTKASKNGKPDKVKIEKTTVTTEADPFLLGVKKKDSQPVSEVGVTPSPSGTENTAQSPSPLKSVVKETKAETDLRHDKIAQADVGSLLTNYNQAAENQFEKEVSSLNLDQGSRPYSNFLQSREGKSGKIISDIEDGKFNPSDINYLAKAAPVAAKQIIESILPDSDKANPLSQENIDKFVTEGRKIVSNISTASKVRNSTQLDSQAKESLTALGVNPEQLKDDKYTTELTNTYLTEKANELDALESQYPIKQVQKVSGRQGYYVNERQKENEYKLKKAEIDRKYADIQNQIGLSKAFDFAKTQADAQVKDIGAVWLKYADPDAYTLWEKNGKKGPIDRDLAEIGTRALYASGNPGRVEVAKATESLLDAQFPDKIIAETYHRLGAELYKDQNWIFNAAPGVAQLDKVAEQLPEKYRDVYNKFIREKERKNLGTDVPMSGLLNKAGEGFGSTAIETWKGLGDILHVRSEKSQVADAINEGMDTDFQGVGTYAPAVNRLKELNNKQKEKKTLTPDEIEEKQDLETFTGVRSTGQEIIDGTGNLTGQVVFQALGTKGLGSVVSGAVKGAGLLKVANVAKALSTEEAIASQAMEFGLSKPAITNISAMAVAYASSFDGAKRDAWRLMPNDEDAGKRTVYATIVGGLNAGTERIFKDEKVLNAFNKEISPSIKNIVSKLDNGKISQELLAKEITNVLKSSKEFLKESLIANTKEATEELATSIGQSIATSILAPAKFNEKAAFDDAVSTFTTTFLHGGLVSTMAGVQAQRVNHIGIPTIAKLGVDEKLTEDTKSFINAQILNGNMSQEEANGKFKVINTASKINNEVMPQVDQVQRLPQKAREKYAVQLLNEKILTAQADESTDEVLKSALEKKVKESEKVRKGILDKEIFVDDNYSVKTIEEINAEEIQEESQPATDGTLQTTEEIESEIVTELGEEKATAAIKEVNDFVENDLFSENTAQKDKDFAKENPLQFLKQVATQAQTPFVLEGKEISARNSIVIDYGEDVVKLAESVFPNLKPIKNEEAETVETKEADVLTQTEGAAETTVPSVNEAPASNVPAIEGIEANKKDNELRRKEELAAPIILSGYKDKKYKYVGGNDVFGATKEEVIRKINEERDAELNELNQEAEAIKKTVPAIEVGAEPDIRQRYLDQFNIVENSAFDWRVTSSLSTKDRVKAIEDIKNGKDTAAAKTLEKEIKEMQERGTVIINRGRGNAAQTVEITVTEWFKLDEKEQNNVFEAADKMDENTARMINESDITLQNLNELKHLFDGFPYEQKDFTAIESYLLRQSKGGIEATDIGESGQSKTAETVKPTESTKPKVRVTAEQLKQSQPKTERQKQVNDIANELRTLLGDTAALEGIGGQRVTLEQLGITENDTIPEVIDKLIAYNGQFSELLKVVKGVPGISDVKFKIAEAYAKKIFPTMSGQYFFDNKANQAADRKTVEVVNPTNAYYTITHEILHWLTVDSDIATKGDKAKLKRLEDIFTFLKGNKGIRQFTNITYGLSDFREFMVELMINPDFRNYISDISVENEAEFRKAVNAEKGFDSKNILQDLYDLVKEFFEKLFNTSDYAKIESNKPLVDQSVQMATDLFFSGNNVIEGQKATGQKGFEITPFKQQKAAAALPNADRNKILSDYVRDKLDQGIDANVIKEGLVSYGLSEAEAQKLIDSNSQKKVRVVVGKDDKSKEGDVIDDYNMTTSDEVNKFLSGSTLEDVFGEQAEGDQQYNVQKLTDMLQDGLNMVSLAQGKWGTDVMDYGKELFEYIQAMSNDAQLTNKKAVLLATFLGEIKEAMLREPTRRAEIQPLYNAVEGYYQRYMNVRGKEVVAGRLLRLYRDKYIGDLFVNRILEERLAKERESILVAEQNKKIDDQTAARDKKVTAAEKDAQDKSDKAASKKAKEAQSKKGRLSTDDAKQKASDKAEEIKNKSGGKQGLIDKINEAIKRLNCK